MPKQKAPIPAMSDETRYLLSVVEDKFSNLEKIIQLNSKQSSAIPETLQPAEVCSRLGWSRSKFEQFKREGLFRTFKIGGKVYVYTSDLVALFPKNYFN